MHNDVADDVATMKTTYSRDVSKSNDRGLGPTYLDQREVLDLCTPPYCNTLSLGNKATVVVLLFV